MSYDFRNSDPFTIIETFLIIRMRSVHWSAQLRVFRPTQFIGQLLITTNQHSLTF